MTIDKEQLKALALAATTGPWYQHGGIKQVLNHDCETVCETYEGEGDCPDAQFIAAANPATVLTLLAEIEGLHAQHARDSGELRKLCSARDSARRQRDQLKAENEALRKDAERYRWVRDSAYGAETIDGLRIMFEAPMPEGAVATSAEKLDMAVDADMKQEVGHG